MKKRYAKAALFLASQAVTLLGSSIVQFAIIWYVTLETSSGGWVALLSAAAYIPQFLISFFAGVWADRYPRKRLIIAADGAIAIATLALVLLLPQIPQNKNGLCCSGGDFCHPIPWHGHPNTGCQCNGAAACCRRALDEV